MSGYHQSSSFPISENSDHGQSTAEFSKIANGLSCLSNAYSGEVKYYGRDDYRSDDGLLDSDDAKSKNRNIGGDRIARMHTVAHDRQTEPAHASVSPVEKSAAYREETDWIVVTLWHHNSDYVRGVALQQFLPMEGAVGVFPTGCSAAGLNLMDLAHAGNPFEFTKGISFSEAIMCTSASMVEDRAQAVECLTTINPSFYQARHLLREVNAHAMRQHGSIIYDRNIIVGYRDAVPIPLGLSIRSSIRSVGSSTSTSKLKKASELILEAFKLIEAVSEDMPRSARRNSLARLAVRLLSFVDVLTAIRR